jgi:cytidylate kinase
MIPRSDPLIAALRKRKAHGGQPGRDSAATVEPCINVAISRQAGSGGVEIARLVAQRTGWTLFDHELLERMAREWDLPRDFLERVDERHVAWLEEVATSFRLEGGREGAYLPSLRHVLRQIARQGHCVVVGRGAAHFLPAETTLRVRVVAPRADRVARIQRLKQVSAEEAARWIDRTDRERAEFVRLEFRQDVNDPLHYDLVLNSGHFTVEECADFLVKVARTLEADLCAQAAAARA